MSTSRFRHVLSFLVILLWTAAGRPCAAGAGFWTPVGPGSAGCCSGLASITVHPSSPGTVWAGLARGGLYRSADRGINWRWAGGPFTTLGYGAVEPAVAADLSRPGALWAATNSGLFHTQDGGAHWMLMSGEEYAAALGEGVDPRKLIALAGKVYVVTDRRLVASSDGGATWEVLYQGSIGSVAAQPSAPRVFYLAENGDPHRFLKSQDGGETWEDVASFPDTSAGVLEIVLAPGTAYAARGGEHEGIFRSTDQGRTWSVALGGTQDRGFHTLSLAISPQAPRTVYASGWMTGSSHEAGLWVSSTAGATWRQSGSTAPSLLQNDGGILYGLVSQSYADSRLIRSLDGGTTWATVLRIPSSESEAAQINFRSGDPARMALAVGSTLYRSVNGGASWKLGGSLTGVYDADLDPQDPNRLIAVTSSAVFLSENAGGTWQKVTRDWELSYPEILVRTGSQTLLIGGVGIYRSGDNGRTWQTVLPGWPAGSDIGRWTQKIEVDPARPSTVYALTFVVNVDGLPHGPLADYGASILWKSTDGGLTWKKMTLNLRTFAVDPRTSRVYGVRNRQLLASDDAGRTWHSIGRTPNVGAYDLAVDPTNSDVLYTTPWLWRSRDRGVTWTLIDSQWAPAVLTLSPRDPRTVYGADRWGVFEITVPD
jgi:photosystem II stability/assembly factor-like uncharacterized protein